MISVGPPYVLPIRRNIPIAAGEELRGDLRRQRAEAQRQEEKAWAGGELTPDLGFRVL